jgi:hypothetical protein
MAEEDVPTRADEHGLTVSRLREFMENASPPDHALVYISMWNEEAEEYQEIPVQQLTVNVRWDGPPWLVLRGE